MAQTVKYLQCGRPGFDPFVRKIPWRRAWQPTPVFLPGESREQRSLVDYSPCGHRVGHGWATNTSLLLLDIEMGFPGGSNGKESARSAGDLGSIPGLGRSSGGGHGNPLCYSCLEIPHGQRSLVGHSSWGHKESNRLTNSAQHRYKNNQPL